MRFHSLRQAYSAQLLVATGRDVSAGENLDSDFEPFREESAQCVLVRSFRRVMTGHSGEGGFPWGYMWHSRVNLNTNGQGDSDQVLDLTSG